MASVLSKKYSIRFPVISVVRQFQDGVRWSNSRPSEAEAFLDWDQIEWEQIAGEIENVEKKCLPESLAQINLHIISKM